MTRGCLIVFYVLNELYDIDHSSKYPASFDSGSFRAFALLVPPFPSPLFLLQSLGPTRQSSCDSSRDTTPILLRPAQQAQVSVSAALPGRSILSCRLNTPYLILVDLPVREGGSMSARKCHNMSEMLSIVFHICEEAILRFVP